MAELGVHSVQHHEQLAAEMARTGFSAAFFSASDDEAGVAFRRGWESAADGQRLLVAGGSYEDLVNGARFLISVMNDDDQLLVKGSRSARMERIFASLEVEG